MYNRAGSVRQRRKAARARLQVVFRRCHWHGTIRCTNRPSGGQSSEHRLGGSFRLNIRFVAPFGLPLDATELRRRPGPRHTTVTRMPRR